MQPPARRAVVGHRIFNSKSRKVRGGAQSAQRSINEGLLNGCSVSTEHSWGTGDEWDGGLCARALNLGESPCTMQLCYFVFIDLFCDIRLLENVLQKGDDSGVRYISIYTQVVQVFLECTTYCRLRWLYYNWNSTSYRLIIVIFICLIIMCRKIK